MNEYDETTLFSSSEGNGVEEYPVPDPFDTWSLDDFDDVLE